MEVHENALDNSKILKEWRNEYQCEEERRKQKLVDGVVPNGDCEARDREQARGCGHTDKECGPGESGLVAQPNDRKILRYGQERQRNDL